MSDKSSPLKVLIAGAGIGGLAVAVGLRQQGHDVHIFEKSAFSDEVWNGSSTDEIFAQHEAPASPCPNISNILIKNLLKGWGSSDPATKRRWVAQAHGLRPCEQWWNERK
ncbi:MAG: hypothetical protein Q9208_002788 [Pyrenodesmia sp. 3 TL-2023]